MLDEKLQTGMGNKNGLDMSDRPWNGGIGPMRDEKKAAKRSPEGRNAETREPSAGMQGGKDSCLYHRLTVTTVPERACRSGGSCRRWIREALTFTPEIRIPRRKRSARSSGGLRSMPRRMGRITIYDTSWYRRVQADRFEGKLNEKTSRCRV